MQSAALKRVPDQARRAARQTVQAAFEGKISEHHPCLGEDRRRQARQRVRTVAAEEFFEQPPDKIGAHRVKPFHKKRDRRIERVSAEDVRKPAPHRRGNTAVYGSEAPARQQNEHVAQVKIPERQRDDDGRTSPHSTARQTAP